jgi:hypothetical protein
MPEASSDVNLSADPSAAAQDRSDIWSMSAEEATAVLAERARDFHPRAPISPQTPRDADLRLQELAADADWYRKLTSGNLEVRAEFDRLTALKNAAPTEDMPTEQIFEVTSGDTGSGSLTRSQMIGAAEDMRRRDGFPDRAIEHILADGRFDAEAVAISQHWIPRMEADPNLLCPDAEQWGWPQDREYQLRCFRTIAAIGTEDMP